MERYAWKNRIREGCQAEYIRRHNELFWPEMTEMFNAAGVHNYSIWIVGDEVFGYMECEKGVDFAIEYQRSSPVKKRWDEYMKDILIRDTDPQTGRPLAVKQVFLHG